jgi:CRISPR-associated endonuclease Csy4
MSQGWLTGMRDHVAVSEIATVPACVGYRVVRRVQAKSSPERLRRRLIARKDLTAEQAVLAIPDSAAETLRLPFLTLKSLSTGQRFRLFIEHLPVQDQASPGSFSAYGLSASATVPWF